MHTPFEPGELKIMEDDSFLLRKVQVIEKLKALLVETRHELKSVVEEFSILPQGASSGKISRGENYKNLPYLILDYPASFGKEDVFAFRTMFWWGHYFSHTLHLSGRYLEEFKNGFPEFPGELANKSYYICVNNTPWEYDFKPNNFKVLEAGDTTMLSTAGFLKISKKTEIGDWNKVPGISSAMLEQVLSLYMK